MGNYTLRIGPASSSLANVNRPSGLVTQLDEDFDYALTTGNASTMRTEWIAAGWSDPETWQASQVEHVVDATGPNGSAGKRVLYCWPAAGAGGTGTIALRKSFTQADQGYMYLATKWESGFDHNNSSEKLVFFGNVSNRVFQYYNDNESLYAVTQDAGDPGSPASELYANQNPNGLDGFGKPIATWPSDGVWVEHEIYWDNRSSAGIFKWWTDGVLMGSHTGRSYTSPAIINLADTWGGGGTKVGNEGRYHDRFILATA